MAYVAPKWKDGGAPPISAAALQAISDAIVGAESKNTSQDSSISALQTAVSALQSGGAKIEVGSYVGTGQSGASSPNSITCTGSFKLIIIYAGISSSSLINLLFTIGTSNSQEYATFPFIISSELTTSYQPGKGPCGYIWAKGNTYTKKSSDGKTVSWYANGDNYQLNVSGITYHWVAFG